MSVLRTIEQKIEGLVERTFGRMFRSRLQPVELARKLAREMDEHRTVSVSRVLVPNEYSVFLSEQDRHAFAAFEGSLVAELASYLDAHARGEGLTTLTRPVVTLITDTDLRVGEFGISCRVADPVPAAAPEAPEAAPAPAPPSRVNEALDGVSGTQVIRAVGAPADEAPAPTLMLLVDMRRHRVTQRVTSVGRSKDCDITVQDPNASRVHLEIRQGAQGEYMLVDMGSTNGTRVNGRRVDRHRLADGDRILIGTSELRVELR